MTREKDYLLRNVETTMKTQLLHLLIMDMKRCWSVPSWISNTTDPNELLSQVVSAHYTWGFNTKSAQSDQIIEKQDVLIREILVKLDKLARLGGVAGHYGNSVGNEEALRIIKYISSQGYKLND